MPAKATAGPGKPRIFADIDWRLDAPFLCVACWITVNQLSAGPLRSARLVGRISSSIWREGTHLWNAKRRRFGNVYDTRKCSRGVEVLPGTGSVGGNSISTCIESCIVRSHCGFGDCVKNSVTEPRAVATGSNVQLALSYVLYSG